MDAWKSYHVRGFSIHALLAESDKPKRLKSRRMVFSIHALLAESDGKPKALKSRLCVFLSTLSLRRATSSKIMFSSFITFFYPRSPCGERPQNLCVSIIELIFLSTLSLRRATLTLRVVHQWADHFLSTLSLRRATSLYELYINGPTIFYPRSPCGERHSQKYINRGPYHFLSTLSLRRATKPKALKSRLCVFSIHALLAESDCISVNILFTPTNFLSTLSLRRATICQERQGEFYEIFYPRSPCGERLKNF